MTSLPVFAQTSTGRISGLVTDPSNASVADATVTVTNLETAAARNVQTDGSGNYAITDLPIGSYKVEVTKQGFKTQTQRGLELVADGRLTVNFALQVGNVSQSVEVVAAAEEQINTVSGEVSRVIDSHQVDNLTMNGRNYVQLMTLVPGAVVTNPDQFSVTTSLASNNQNINGNRADSNNLTVDGAYNSVAGSNSSLVNNVSPDFVQEVKIQTSNFSAEYGRFSGPAFNIITKSGTNQFHGGAVRILSQRCLRRAQFLLGPKNGATLQQLRIRSGRGRFEKTSFSFLWVKNGSACVSSRTLLASLFHPAPCSAAISRGKPNFFIRAPKRLYRATTFRR